TLLSDPFKGPYYVSVRVDYPPSVVYPHLSLYLAKISEAIKRPVIASRCGQTQEIYAITGKDELVLVTQEEARQCNSSNYETGVVLETESNCLPGKCQREGRQIARSLFCCLFSCSN
ncbi:hypothetical protein PRIPAC_75374, partial [Pristionchus pacificus]|uniref:Uncharacterized protein n=1 Tax=Pristionchus pacificus TaxID=54126 RepID=A0A2A6BRC1_PRIPA